MTIYTDEIFGPVLVVLRVDTLDEAIALVNRNPYGNGTAIFTRVGRARRGSSKTRSKSGWSASTSPIPVPMAFFSFGGWKQSLFGDLHVLRHGGHRVLHAHQGDHHPLARARCRVGGLPHADDGVAVVLRAGGLVLGLMIAASGASRASLQTPAAPACAPEAQTEAIWTCPVHAVVAEKGAGKCAICRRDLVPVTATVTWTCADRPDIDRPVQGKCPDGSPMERRYTQSTHANHNPRHGGMFFMAPDLWHHLEGAYLQDETFRVYLYDDFTRPLAPELARQVSGRVVLKETFDSATRTTKELVAVPLTMAAGGEYLEARVGKIKLPAEMTAKVKFTRDMQEYRFDFTFPEFSIDASVRARRRRQRRCSRCPTAAPRSCACSANA